MNFENRVFITYLHWLFVDIENLSKIIVTNTRTDGTA